MSANFKWGLGEEPPLIEEHSKAKLEVLRSYLREYFDRLNANPARDRFKLDFVDGFCGGGTFRDSTKTISGTPLIMLEESKDAAKRLNKGRRKELDFDCRFYFVDKKKAHTDTLKKILRDREYNLDDEKIYIRTGAFEAEADSIINEIKNHQPRSGRAIFLLDQTGYSHINLSIVKNILRQLPAVEIILTFAVDAMLNFLAKNRPLIKAYDALGLSDAKVLELLEEKDKPHGRAAAQRILLQHLKNMTNAPFYTPFFIRPEESHRTLWFIHLSKHPTARNVMIERHWEHHNRFEHCGYGNIGMMGFDAVYDAVLKSKPLSLLNFSQHERNIVKEKNMESLARELQSSAYEVPITIDALLHRLVNETAATHSDLKESIIRLRREKEIQILDSDGNPIQRRTRLHLTDRIALHGNLSLPIPGLSRRKRN